MLKREQKPALPCEKSCSEEFWFNIQTVLRQFSTLCFKRVGRENVRVVVVYSCIKGLA